MQLYGSFEEKGYRFEAYTPDRDEDPVAFEVRILAGGELKGSLLIQLTYVPVFGVDVDDSRHLEFVVDRMLKFLPEPDKFGEAEIRALSQLEEEVGGQRARAAQEARSRVSNPQLGDFEYTGELFVGRFAHLLGGPEAARAWMKVPLPELQNRTPEEALRLGFAPEVVKYLSELPARQSHE